MRKNYVYAITLILLTLFAWLGYYLYLEYRPVSYKNGTFVEMPYERFEDTKELSA